MSMVHKKNVPRKYPTFFRVLHEKGYFVSKDFLLKFRNYNILSLSKL